MADVIEINDVDELDRWRLWWSALLQETKQASFFQSLDWLQAYWAHFGGPQRLRTLVVVSGGRPIGIVPLTERTERAGLGSISALTYPLDGWGNFFGPIGPNPTATLLAAARHVMSTERDWDLFDLRWINEAECDRGRTAAAMQAVGAVPRRQLWRTTSVIDFAVRWDRYLGQRDRRLRERIRRSESKAREVGGVSFERYRPGGLVGGDVEPGWDLFSHCIDLALRRTEKSLNSGTALSDESARAFVKDAHAAAVNRGALDLCLLRLDGQPIAYVYSYHIDGDVAGLWIGSHPAFASLDPETLLLSRFVRDSIRRGDHRFNLPADAQADWATRSVASHRCTHYAAGSAKAQLLRAKHWWDTRRSG